MKTLLTSTLVAGLMMSSVVNAEISPGSVRQQFTPELEQSSLAVHRLDPIVENTTRAGFAPLAIALGIASIDLALMGFYYGVYVPYYSPQEPSFNYNIQ